MTGLPEVSVVPRLVGDLALVAVLPALAGALVLCVTLLALLWRAGVARPLGVGVAMGASLPYVVLVFMAQQHFVDVPRWDIWEIVPLIELQHEGALGFGDLWRAHNTHRPLTGRVLLLANVFFARWNHWLDLTMLLVVAALQLAVLAAFVARTQGRQASVHPATLIVLAVFVFTLVQWENWLQGWQVLLLLGACSVSAALLVLAEGRGTWLNLALASVLALVGTASFASCLLVWPLGALAIAGRGRPGWHQRVSAWTMIAIVAFGGYLYDLPPDPSAGDTGLLWSLTAIRRVLAGIMVSVATPVVYRAGSFSGPPGATEWAILVVGGVALVGATLIALVRWRTDSAREGTWLFPVLLCLFGLGAGSLAAIGRSWWSVQSMTAARYVVFGACFWAGLVLLLAIRSPGQPRGARWATVALLVIAGLAGAENWTHALPHMEAHRLSSEQARSALLRGDLHAAAAVLYPDPPELDRRRAILQKHGLSVYRPGAGR